MTLNKLPIAEIATLDYIANPDRNGTGGVYRDSQMFKALLSYMNGIDLSDAYRLYDKAWLAACLKDYFQTKIAILQLHEKANNRNRRFVSIKTLKDLLNEKPNCDNYELIYVRNEETTAITEIMKNWLNNSIFREFNSDQLRPRSYYGHSVSIGDVIVIVNDFKDRNAYYVDSAGFTKLPGDFLSPQMCAKIYTDLDIQQEYILYENIMRFQAEHLITVIDNEGGFRFSDITLYYLHIFEAAERRGATLDIQTNERKGITMNSNKTIITEESANIRVEGHRGTWYVIDNEIFDGNCLFLLESEQYGDEAALLIIDESGNLILDDVYNGFDDYRERCLESDR